MAIHLAYTQIWTKCFATRDTSLKSNRASISMMIRLHWDFGYSCVVHFLDILMSLGLIFDGDTQSQCLCTANTSKYLNDYISFFIKLSFHEPTFSLYKPLQQTGAVIMAARHAINISPIWRDDLADLVGVSFDEFRECYERLWNVFCSKYDKKPKEEIKPSPTNIFFS